MKKKKHIILSDDIFGVLFGTALFFVPTWVHLGDPGTLLLQVFGILIGGFCLMRLLIGY